MLSQIDWFTFITGLVGFLGFLLQLTDSFPDHRETRKTVVLVVLGIFLGSLISGFKDATFAFGQSLRPFDLLVGLFFCVLALVAIAGAFANDSYKRTELFSFAGIGVIPLLVILFFGGLVSGGESESRKHERKMREITVEELIDLSSGHAAKKNYERAINLLLEVKGRLPQEDPRVGKVDEKIAILKEQQVK